MEFVAVGDAYRGAFAKKRKQGAYVSQQAND